MARFPGEFARLVGSPPFLPRDDQLARYMLSLCVTVRSISASVRPSGSRKQRHTMAKGLTPKSRRNFNAVTPYTGALARGGVSSDWRFATNISLYLRNVARQGHSYYGTVIGTRMRSIEWRYFQHNITYPYILQLSKRNCKTMKHAGIKYFSDLE